MVQRKLALLDTQVVNLEKHLAGVSRERFEGDWMLRSMAERALQVSVEIVIDICERIIALAGAGPVASASDAVRRAADLGVLSSVDPYVDMVKLRNLIVHEYEEIDPALLYELATARLAVFRRFRDELDRME